MASVRRRVEEVAGVLGVTPAVILATCRELGIGVASPQSMLDAVEVAALRDRLGRSRRNVPAGGSPGQRRPPRASDQVQANAWAALTKHRQAGTPVRGVVTAVVKGGLLVDVGVRGFMPASQVDSDWIDDLQPYVGKQVSAKVIDMDAARRSVVLSRRELVDQRRQERAAELRGELRPGTEVDAKILKKTDRGIVVRVDDALEVWVPMDQVTAEVRDMSAGEHAPITICDISESRVLGSFRLASAIAGESDPSSDEISFIASKSGGLLKVQDGALTVELRNEDGFREQLSKAVEVACDGGATALFVASEPSMKRSVRRLIQNGDVPGVDARRSRQAPDGLELALITEGK